MRILNHRMTWLTSRSAIGHQCQSRKSQISRRFKMPQPLASQQTTTPVTPDVTIPMLQDNTVPSTVPGMVVYNIVAAANQAPSFGRGVPVARASPMQIGTPVTSPQRTPMHGITIEEALLQGARLPCSPRQEANLLNPPLMLMDNHIKMMDALCHLSTSGLQFICESVEALCQERTPVQAPPGYCMLQASDPLQGTTTRSPLSQEFYHAANNLSTRITVPQQTPPQQHLAGDHHPDPEIVSTITNMQRHEQASRTQPTSRDE